MNTVFDKNYDVRETARMTTGGKPRLEIRGTTTDNYWISADMNKHGEYDVMIGQKRSDVGGAGSSMNPFFNRTVAPAELDNAVRREIEADRKKTQ